MEFYSTNNRDTRVNLKEAVLQGLAPDNGLYMPVAIPKLPPSFFGDLPNKKFNDLAFEIAHALIGDDLSFEELKRIVDQTISFEAPLVKVGTSYALELFHGPTLAFKDFGARFLAGLLGYYAKQQDREVTVLVATSGDTGSAVANGFLNVPGTRVVVLYPSGKVSEIQEKQFTTLGANIVALEVDGTFDDCQQMVKEAFLDKELRTHLFLTSANSINIGRLIPQLFYYFRAYAQLKDPGQVVISVPSGNFGNLTAGLIAKKMGLPIDKFIASTNVNDAVPEYLTSGNFRARSSRQTISNAMDVGNPSNFARMLDLYHCDLSEMQKDIVGYRFTDEETSNEMKQVYQQEKYILDPHGAVGLLGLKKFLRESKVNGASVFLETAHPGKFNEVVEDILQQSIELPDRLRSFLVKSKKSIPIRNDFNEVKTFLLKN
jgi:threonine synthase